MPASPVRTTSGGRDWLAAESRSARSESRNATTAGLSPMIASSGDGPATAVTAGAIALALLAAGVAAQAERPIAAAANAAAPPSSSWRRVIIARGALRALDADQLDFEDQRRARWDHATGAAVAVAQMCGDDQLALATHLNPPDAFVPALDDPAAPDRNL